MVLAGIVGGLGPESTVDYYQAIIERFQIEKNDHEVLPHLIIHSINMYHVFELIEQNDLSGLVDYLVSAIQILENAGADYAVIAANTPHLVFDKVKEEISIPLYSIIEETYGAVEHSKIHKVGLLGTKFTMKRDFFKHVFTSRGKEIYVPTEKEQ